MTRISNTTDIVLEEFMKPALFAKGNKRTLNTLLQLRRQAMADKASRVLQRIQGVMLSIEKKSISEIAEILHVHRSSVHTWVTLWNEHGVVSLYEGHRSGRPRQLNDNDKERLADIVESGPVAYGLNTGVWTSPVIAMIIEDEFGVSYHPGHVRKLLHALGFSVQRPTTKLVQADPKRRNKWVRYTYPNLKKKPAQKGA